ncbi:MAG: glycosyltransferase, partial [Candidatus Bathyarchaeota archaeon]|nr:glycosyltransferase [Candidatus Bathyarchaeota archaeon]
YLLKTKFPKFYRIINKINKRDFIDFFEEKLKEIQPDVVQSFEMHSSCVPILEVMKKYPRIKWVYTAWGTDIYYYKREPNKVRDMEKTFPSINYMFADCNRDYRLAKNLGFQGVYLGTFPGGGGYTITQYSNWLKNFNERNIILIKGYQHKFGRCNKILEALLKLKNELTRFQIVIFGANDEVAQFVGENFKDFKNVTVKGRIGQSEVLQLMGNSFVYLGNSISDGTPNTMLEAIIMEVFPIQSDPGGATAEIIIDGKNGLLIKDPEDSREIAKHLYEVIKNSVLVKAGIMYNNKYVKPTLEREYIKRQVLKKYDEIKNDLGN